MNVIAVSGSYRADGVIDRAMQAAVAGARDAGAHVGELFLRDIHFGHCNNCRTCWDPAVTGPVGPCPVRDDLTHWLRRIAAADGLILASPINVGALTAVFKQFSERFASLSVLTPAPLWKRWLTGVQAFPTCRVKRRGRTMLWITGSLAPALVGRGLMKAPRAQFSGLRELWPARLVDFMWIGGVATADWKLSEKQLHHARRAGAAMVRTASC